MVNRLSTFRFWCQKVLPLVYDESLSYYELLCKVVDYLNRVIEDNNSIRDILDIHENDIIKLQDEVSFLLGEIEKIKKGDYISSYIDGLTQWINDNLIEMVSNIAKFVSFGLDDEGYFIAIIPQSWKDIEFSTNDDNRLVLTF